MVEPFSESQSHYVLHEGEPLDDGLHQGEPLLDDDGLHQGEPLDETQDARVNNNVEEWISRQWHNQANKEVYNTMPTQPSMQIDTNSTQYDGQYQRRLSAQQLQHNSYTPTNNQSTLLPFSDPAIGLHRSQSNSVAQKTRTQSNLSGTSSQPQMQKATPIHKGNFDIKQQSLFNEMLRDFKIEQYGCIYAREHFKVGQPSLLKEKYVVYMTKGVDQGGYRWEANRRYNEFFSLKETQARMWPGLYIPYMPSKKLIGNRDVKFIIERRYFLERFYMQMSRYDYLIYGGEWQLFCRPKEGPKDGDLATQLKVHAQIPFMHMLHNYMTVLHVDAEMLKTLYNTAKRTEADYLLAQFEEFLKRLKGHFKQLKKQVKALIDTQQTKIDLDKQVIIVLNKFEERTNQFTDSQHSKTDPQAKQQQQVHLQSNILTQEIVRQGANLGLGNPFFPMLYYIKGEISDVKAMEITLLSRVALIKSVQGLVSQRSKVAHELQEKIQGTISLSISTFKTMFKNNQERQTYNQNLQKEIDRLRQEEIACEQVAAIVDYILMQQVHSFKTMKIEELARVVREMSQTEIDTSNATAEFWSNLLGSHPNLNLINT